MARPNDFTRAVQRAALERQRNYCASCGTSIAALGERGRAQHRFGEGAHAHHLRHAKLGGSGLVDNCVILCTSCHYCVHEGGNYRRGTVVGTVDDYPHFSGQCADADCLCRESESTQ
jgi:5-methylcytosine-specific restriction endonuclease McrA